VIPVFQQGVQQSYRPSRGLGCFRQLICYRSDTLGWLKTTVR